MESMLGLCPRCNTTAPVGEPCPIPACRADGIHAIPDPYAAAIQGAPDPRLGRVVGDYLLVQRLHHSHLSTVFLALQVPFLMKAAFKVLHPHAGDPELRRLLADQFRAEAAAVAALDHPNTVRLLKYGEVDEYPYLVTEFVDGAHSLEDELNERARQSLPLSLRAARHILSQLVRVLEAAHRQGLVHADVKPGNVLLQKLPDDPLHLRLIDFGLVRHHADGKSELQAGTPDYLAPEQITDEPVGPWTDLYAVAEMAFELVLGHLPFRGPDPHAVVKAKTAPNADPLATLGDVTLPPFVLGFFRRALAREPGRRFGNTPEFREALEWVFDALEAVSGSSDEPDPQVDDPRPTGQSAPPGATDVERRKRKLLAELEESFVRDAERKAARLRRRPRAVLLFAALAALVAGGFTVGAVVGDWVLDARARRIEVARSGSVPPLPPAPAPRGPEPVAAARPDADPRATAPDVAPTAPDTAPDAASAEVAPATPDADGARARTDALPEGSAEGREPAWVTLSPTLSMTRTEVTVRAYRACVAAAACTPPGTADGCSGLDPAHDILPITCVDGYQARVYCRWQGGHLPTPEEWLSAATDAGRRTWPWGNDAPTCDRVVMNETAPGCGTKGPFPVCSHPAGASPLGLCDLVGNVAEWTAGTDGSDQVFLGGGWRDTADLLDVGMRGLRAATESDVDLGFRCAR